MKNKVIKLILIIMGFNFSEKYCYRVKGGLNTFWSFEKNPPSDDYEYLGNGIIAEKIP